MVPLARGLAGRAAAAAAAILLFLPGLTIGPSLDASIFSTVGWRLTQGDALYAEVWDHKPPGAYLPSVIAHLVTDEPSAAWAVTWLLSILSVVVAAVLVRAILVRHGIRPAAADVSGLLFVLGTAAYLVSLGGGMSETFALAPLAGALLAASTGRWLVAGLAFGLAAVISLQSVPLIVPIAILGAGGGSAATMRRGLLVTIGALVLLAGGGLALWANGGLGAAVDALLTYSAAYRQVTARPGGASAFALVPWTVLALLPLVVGIGLAAVHRRRLAAGRLAVVSVAWILAGITLVMVQGRFYAHYATPLVIPAAVLSGIGVDAAWRATPTRLRSAVIGVPLLLATGIALAVGAVGAGQEQAPISASNERAQAVADRVREVTDVDDRILVWGNDARVYELSGRAPATRYVYLYPLLTPGYVTDGRVADVVAELRGHPLAAVVDSGSLAPGEPGLPPLLEPRPIATDGRDTDLLGPIRDLVREDFRLEAPVDRWLLYVTP